MYIYNKYMIIAFILQFSCSHISCYAQCENFNVSFHYSCPWTSFVCGIVIENATLLSLQMAKSALFLQVLIRHKNCFMEYGPASKAFPWSFNTWWYNMVSRLYFIDLRSVHIVIELLQFFMHGTRLGGHWHFHKCLLQQFWCVKAGLQTLNFYRIWLL